MRFTIILVFLLVFFVSCDSSIPKKDAVSSTKKLSVIFDTDANNELDDQHALAYLFSNQDYFDIQAVTVNATRNGGNIQGHYDEAERIMHLFYIKQEFPC